MNGRRLAKRLAFAAVLTAVAAAILYYGAVWLLIRRVATMLIGASVVWAAEGEYVLKGD